MRRFDYSFLNNGLLPANLVNLTASIASLKTMASVRKDEHIRVFTELEAIAKVQSVKSSNAIEGIVTSDERIAEIVNQNSAPLNHNEVEIAGYRDALNEIHLGYEHINFRQRDILRLHEMLLSVAGYEYGPHRWANSSSAPSPHVRAERLHSTGTHRHVHTTWMYAEQRLELVENNTRPEQVDVARVARRGARSEIGRAHV